MNGKKAKLLRKAAYGDKSLRVKREYVESNHRPARGFVTKTLTNARKSPRAIYQKLKRAYKTAA